MGKQQRVSLRRFDSPEIVELDDKPIVFEKRRAGDLAWIVKSYR